MNKWQSNQNCFVDEQSAKRKKSEGFTLIELLVVIAIIALLLSIIMPALSKVKDQVKRVICANNSRQCGMAVHAYTESNNQQIIPNYRRDEGKMVPATPDDLPNPFRSYMVYYPDETDSSGNYEPYNLAVLYEQGYLDNPEIFYCPAQPRTTEDYDIPYYYDFYIGEGKDYDYSDPAADMGNYEWGTHIPADSRGSDNRVVRTSFNYWTHGETKLANISGFKPLIFDNIQEWEVVPHRKGRGVDSEPQGLTVLFADGHSTFCNDSKIFEDDGGNGPWNKDLAGSGNGPGNNIDWFNEILRRIGAQ